MSRLYLSCHFCTRKQADGLLSRGYWGHVDVGNGTELRACPACKGANPDWEARLRAAAASSASASDEHGFGFQQGTVPA
jgi:hypothetical protein